MEKLLRIFLQSVIIAEQFFIIPFYFPVFYNFFLIFLFPSILAGLPSRKGFSFMKRFKNKSLLPQYIILYVLSALVPIALVGFSVMQSNRALKAEVLKSNQASVRLIQEALDETFLELESTLEFLGTDVAFSKFSLENDSTNAVKHIHHCVSTNSCLHEIILNIRSGGQLYSSGGIISKQSVGLQDFMVDHPATDWLEMANTVTEPTFWPVNSHGRYLFLFSPLYYNMQFNDSATTRSAVLVIRQQYIEELFRSSRTTESDNILLLNKNLDLLSMDLADTTNDNALLICQYIKENPQVLEDGYAELEENGILLFVSRSSKTGLSYVRFLPKSVAYSALESQGVYTVTLVIFALLIAALLLSISISSSYAPIRKLASWVRDQQPEAEYGNRDELSLFRMALDDAFTQNATLTQVVDQSRQGRLDQLLANLIGGNFASKEAFLDACKALDICLDKPHYTVCSLLIEEGSELPEFDQLVATIRSDLPPEFCLEAKDMLVDRKLILVIGSDTNDLDFYSVAITDMKNRLLEQESLLTSIGMGSFYDTYEMVGKSYLDSINALDYRMVYGRDCLITPDIYNGNSPGLSDSYPSSDLELLDASLTSQNAEMAVAVLHRINANIKLKNYSLHVAKYICFDIFSIFKKDADFINPGTVRTLPETLDIANLTNYGTIDEYFAALLEVVQTKFENSKDGETPQQANIGEQLLQYTDAHCLSYDFQIKGMAEHFNISPQYMRKLFKNHTGMSVSDYVSNKRLEKSMYLLAQTDRNLQEVVMEIGNSDISGFVRFFKQRTGMTPGQYRKANRPQAASSEKSE